MKSTTVIAAVTALAASVWAQNGSNMIPSDASQGCKDFLTKLNNDQNIATCLNKLVDATSSFEEANGNVNATAVSNTLNTICATSFTACSEPTIRTTLANYYTACSNELLVSKQDTVIGMYDVLYLVIPMKNAICARNGSKYCLQQITVVGDSTHATSSSPSAAPSSSGAPSSSAPPASSSQAPAKRDEISDGGLVVSAETIALLKSTPPYKVVSDESNGYAFGITPNVKRQDPNQNQIILPNADLYRNTSLPYLFINPSYTLDQLCTECTKQVIGSYVTFESVTPYALGIANSPILKGQLELWDKLKQCPSGFANSILDNSIPNRSLTGAASATKVISATLGVVFAAFGMGVLSL